MTGRELLDLAELFEDPADFAAMLRSTQAKTVDELVASASPPSDATSRRAAHTLLQRLGAVTEHGTVVRAAAVRVAELLELALDLRSELTARLPRPTSQLVVTATSSPELTALRRTLHLRPLFQLIEDVVRASVEECTLGAPFWNSAALERLQPSLSGLARRRGRIQFICQGAARDDPFNPVGILNRFCQDLLAEGSPACEVWAFDVESDTGERALIHAKFALADKRLGCLGSANMTGQGFAEHFEIGVRLAPEEASDLSLLLERLREGSFLSRRV